MSYQIRVNCTCGKVLKIPEKYSGKKGRCPNCGKKIAIPSIEEIKQKMSSAKDTETEVRHCPTCGAYLNPGDDVCVSCRTNLSTGEWDTEGIKSQEYGEGNKLHMIIAGIAIVVILIAGFTFIYKNRVPKDKTNESSLPPLPPSDKNKIKTEAVEELKKLTDMPENTIVAIQKKIEAFENFIESNTNIPSLMREFYTLKKKKRELEVRNLHEKIASNKNIFDKYNSIRMLKERYKDTSYADTKLKEDEKKYKNKIIEYVAREMVDLQEISSEKKHKEVIRKAIDKLIELSIKTSGIPELGKEINSAKGIIESSLTLLDQKQESVTEEKKDSLKEELDILKIETAKVIPKCREYAKNWEFVKLANYLKPYYETAQKLSSKYPDDPHVITIFTLEREANLLHNFWKLVIRGAKNSIDKPQILFLKAGGVEDGILTNYQDEKLIVKKKGKEKAISLRSLKSNALIGLAKNNNNKDALFYSSIACFACIEKDADVTQKMAEKALANGASKDLIDPYLKWSAEIRNKKIKEYEKLNERDEAKKKELEEMKAENRLKRKKSQAWLIISKMLKDYKLNKDIVVLAHLQDLKDLFADEKGELIKISNELKDKEGHGLDKIADRAFKHCRACDNSGRIKCPNCGGTGEELKKDDGWTKGYPKKRFCKRCNGSGEIDCPVCYAKRNSRHFKMLVDYYDSF